MKSASTKSKSKSAVAAPTAPTAPTPTVASPVVAKFEAYPGIRLLEEIELLGESKAKINRLSISISNRVQSLVDEQVKSFLSSLNVDQVTVVLQALSEANNLKGIMLLLDAAEGVPDPFVRAFKPVDLMIRLFDSFVEHTYHIPRDNKQYNKLGELVLAIRESCPDALSSSHSVKAIQRAAELGVKLSFNASTKILESDEFSLTAKMQALSTLKSNHGGYYDAELKKFEATVSNRLVNGRIDDSSIIEKVIEAGLSPERLLSAIMKSKERVYTGFLVQHKEHIPAAQEFILESENIGVIAEFFRSFGNACDQEKFVKRISELMTPSPNEMAKALLGLGGGRGDCCFPMHRMHPMMFMHPGFGKW